jgi:YD repeat-containing protein
VFSRRIAQTATDKSWWNYPASASAKSYSANTLNQYSAVGAVTPTYDANGNLTYDGTYTYGYDAENRLTGITQGMTTIATYAYDAQGRRKSKTVGGTTTLYVTDSDNREVVEYTGAAGAIQNWYAYGLGIDEPLNRINVPGGTRQTMVPDVHGSVAATLDSSGTLTKTGFQTYGENPSLTSGSYLYTGRRFDAETAGSTAEPSGLYYYRARVTDH